MSTPIGIGVVGLGSRGSELVRAFAGMPSVDLRWICDDGPATARRAWRRMPRTRSATRIEDVLRDVDVGAVAIATPVAARGELVRRALEARKHVLVESPLALESPDADELAQLAVDQGLRLVAGSPMCFHPAAQRLRELIASGALGELYYLYGSRLQLSSRPTDESVLWGPGAHAVSVLLSLVGDEPVDVVARGGPCASQEAADVAFCHLRFATGIEAELRISRVEPQPTQRLTAVGSRGMAVFDELDAERPLTIHELATDADDAACAGDVVSPRLSTTNPLRAQCEHFVATVASPGDVGDRDRAGAAGVAVLEALQRSLERGGSREPVAGRALPAPVPGVIRLPLRSG